MTISQLKESLLAKVLIQLGLYCDVTLNAGENPTGDLERDLKLWVR